MHDVHDTEQVNAYKQKPRISLKMKIFEDRSKIAIKFNIIYQTKGSSPLSSPVKATNVQRHEKAGLQIAGRGAI